jgi:hypothetical protein
VTIVTKGEGSGLPRPPSRPHALDVSEGDTGPDGEEVVRLGDEHVSGIESLCVGESQ